MSARQQGGRELRSRILLRSLLGLCALCFCASPSLADQQEAAATACVRFETEIGDVTVLVDLVRAPLAGGYFLEFVDSGRYEGATFYRAAALDGATETQLVQGGILGGQLAGTGPVDIAAQGIPLLRAFESTNQSGLRHQRATLSLARDLLDTNAVIPEFVIYLRDAPQVDANGTDRPDRRGYPAIGAVVAGLDVIESVAKRERGGATTISLLRGQVLTEPVRVLRATRVSQDCPSDIAGHTSRISRDRHPIADAPSEIDVPRISHPSESAI